MPYMLLIMEPVGQRAERGTEAGQQAYNQMLAFGAELQQQGLLLAGESLAETRRAARLQVRQGQTGVVDGPFAEAKEMLGGFFLLNVDTREQALAIAARCPAAEWCTVEVRCLAPCWDSGD